MDIAGFDDVILTREQQRLLGGWRDIIDGLRRLCRSLNVLPDSCACGQGASHLRGSCPCCSRMDNDHVPYCDDCDELLTSFGQALDLLVVDTMRFFPVVRDLLHAHAPESVRAEGASIEHDIADVDRTFRRLVVAANEFREGCRASQLQTLKARADDLGGKVNQLDRKLEGPQR